MPNADFAALTYHGGAAWRGAARGRRSARPGATSSTAHDDDALAALMTNLGGHCMETLVEAFDAAQDDVPTLFIAYTIKGFGLPFAGHKDNHAGLMNPAQTAALRDAMGIAEGEEWEPLAGLGGNSRAGRRGAARAQPHRRARSATRPFGTVAIPAIPAPPGEEQSTQAAFGRILLDLVARRRRRSPTGSSPPRPTSPSRPTSAPG